MRKKILVPVMALAMIVTAGVNYGMMLDGPNNKFDLSLSSLVKEAFAVTVELPEVTVSAASPEVTVSAPSRVYKFWDKDHYTDNGNCGDVRDSDNEGDFWDDVFNRDYEQDTEECWSDWMSSAYMTGSYGGVGAEVGGSYYSQSNSAGGQRQVCNGGNNEYCESTNCY